MARDIKRGAAPNVLEEWLSHSLNCPVEFRILATDFDRYVFATNTRESFAKIHEKTRITTIQRIAEVMLTKERLELKRSANERVNAASIAQAYTDNIQLAASSEKVSKTYVEQALLIHTRIWHHESIMNVIMRCEKYGAKNPFDLITVLHGFVVKGKNYDEQLWLFEGLEHYLMMKDIRLSDVSVRWLIGDSSSSRGIADCILFQKDLRDHLISTFLVECGLPQVGLIS